MALKTIIHKIDTDKTECIVSVYEDDVLIIDKVNIGINPSGNTAPLITAISELLRMHRYNELKI